MRFSDKHKCSAANKCQEDYGAIFSQLIEVIFVGRYIGSFRRFTVIVGTQMQILKLRLIVLEKQESWNDLFWLF